MKTTKFWVKPGKTWALGEHSSIRLGWSLKYITGTGKGNMGWFWTTNSSWRWGWFLKQDWWIGDLGQHHRKTVISHDRPSNPSDLCLFKRNFLLCETSLEDYFQHCDYLSLEKSALLISEWCILISSLSSLLHHTNFPKLHKIGTNGWWLVTNGVLQNWDFPHFGHLYNCFCFKSIGLSNDGNF